MREYLISVFSVCLIFGVLSRLSFWGEELEKIALSVITLYIVASPLVGAIGDMSFDSILPPDKDWSEELNYGYEEVAEDAFAEGIARAIEEKFVLKSGSVRVRVFGFDFKSMKAEKIKIILSGKSAGSDYRRIKSYADSLDLGECEVDIEIG